MDTVCSVCFVVVVVGTGIVVNDWSSSRGVPADSDILGNSARYLATRKIIKNSFKILSYHHDNGDVLNRSSMDIDLFNTNLLLYSFLFEES
jgi:hypothetical protein